MCAFNVYVMIVKAYCVHEIRKYRLLQFPSYARYLFRQFQRRAIPLFFSKSPDTFLIYRELASVSYTHLTLPTIA